ncbi:MAG TPA: hypothetical protein VGR43_10390 [Dehalococcoidia bacterium]|jgi:hypothetical protein|nr:hypothetical protein [Dehalococcoidia bacterium]
MGLLPYTLNRWSTEELVGEVVKRTAADGPALRLVEGLIIRARLAESDRRFVDFGTQRGAGSDLERGGVRGTMEMGLADGGD